jgi:methionine synthase II (cobalamin-independent)
MSKRFQTVGSLLRPDALLRYKRQIELRDDITYPFYNDFQGYENCELEATREVVAKQIQHGLSVLTDGEYSRSLWHLDFAWGLKGIVRCIAEHGLFFHDKDPTQKYETRRDVALRITQQLDGKNHHFIKLFQRLQSLTGDHTIKFTIPAPSHIFGELLWASNIGRQDCFYVNPQERKIDLIKAYKEFVEEYADVGGNVLEFDDCLWELFADDAESFGFSQRKVNDGEGRALTANFIDIKNAMIDFGHSLGLRL